jgi:hypothetical protein
MSQKQEWNSLVNLLNQIPALIEQQRSAQGQIDELHQRVFALKGEVDQGKLTREEFHKQMTPLRMELLLMDFLIQVHGQKLDGLLKATETT